MSIKGQYSRNILDKLSAAGSISDDGKNWLLQALDPFYDGQHPVAGFPDQSTGKSIVQQVTKTLTVKRPSSVPAGSPFDTHIFFLPELRDPQSNVRVSVIPGVGSSYTSDERGYQWGPGFYGWRAPITVVSCPSGENTVPTDSSFASTNLAFQGFDLNDFATPQSRVIACGFEVVNTTADLYKGGSLVAYEFNNSNNITLPRNYVDEPENQEIKSLYFESRAPPTNIQQAMLLPNSVKWAAEEGAYVVCKLNKQDNPPTDSNVAARIFLDRPYDPYSDTSGGGFGTHNPQTNSNYTCKPLPFNSCGVYLADLNSESTIEVTIRLFIEVFPTFNNPNLVVLASPCCEYDSNVLEIYSKIANSLPPAVVVAENANGGWFSKVLSFAKKFAPTIGGALNTIIPGAGLVGTGVGGLASLLERVSIDKEAAKRAQKDMNIQRGVYYSKPPPRKQMTVPSPNKAQPRKNRSSSKRKKTRTV